MDGEDGGGKGVADVQEEEHSNGGGLKLLLRRKGEISGRLTAAPPRPPSTARPTSSLSCSSRTKRPWPVIS